MSEVLKDFYNKNVDMINALNADDAEKVFDVMYIKQDELETKIKQLKSRISHIKRVCDYQEHKGNKITPQLRTAIIGASQFSLRER